MDLLNLIIFGIGFYQMGTYILSSERKEVDMLQNDYIPLEELANK